MSKYFLGTFVLIIVAVLISIPLKEDFPVVQYLVKPCIMISLILWFWTKTKNIPSIVKGPFTCALIFCLLGDIFLMFDGKIFFLLGLGAFLIGHLGYVWTYSLEMNPKDIRWGKSLIPLIILVVFNALLLVVIFSKLKDMTIPVLVYMAVISLMALMGYLRQGHVNALSFCLVLSGVILFVLSDASIALAKFAYPDWNLRYFTLLTYMVAQLSIVWGVAENILHPAE